MPLPPTMLYILMISTTPHMYEKMMMMMMKKKKTSVEGDDGEWAEHVHGPIAIYYSKQTSGRT